MPHTNTKNTAVSIILKFTGLLVAAAALVYKVIFAVTYFDKITDWWGGTIALYFVLYITSIATVASAFLKGMAGQITAITTAVVSGLFLGVDFIMWLGFAATLNSNSLISVGIAPLVNVLNIIACAFIAIGSLKKV